MTKKEKNGLRQRVKRVFMGDRPIIYVRPRKEYL